MQLIDVIHSMHKRWYVTFLEEQLETPIKIISVGPDRAQTIERYTEE